MESTFWDYILESNLINVLIVVVGLSFVAFKLNVSKKLEDAQSLIRTEFDDARQLQQEMQDKVDAVKATLATLEAQFEEKQKKLQQDIQHYQTHVELELATKQQQLQTKAQRSNELLSRRYADRLLSETVDQFESGVQQQTHALVNDASQSQGLMEHWLAVLTQQLPTVSQLLQTEQSQGYQATTTEAHYALALWCQAIQQGVAPAVRQAFDSLATAMRDSKAMRAFCEAPQIELAEKQTLIHSLLTSMEAPPLFVQFMSLVVDARRLSQLLAIHEAFTQCADATDKDVTVRLCSSHPLQPAHQDQLSKVLKQALQAHSITFDVSVDAALIHGLSIQVFGYRIEAHVRSGLQQLTTHLRAS
jgi:ATP synthase F1 delta subunit